MNVLCPIFLEMYPLVTSNTLYVYTEREWKLAHSRRYDACEFHYPFY